MTNGGYHYGRVFVDSSAYLALLDRRDNKHSEAKAIVRGLASGRFRQFTTNVLVIETHGLLLSRMGQRQATQFLREMRQTNTIIVRAQQSDEERAQEIIFRYEDKDFSLADAISKITAGSGPVRFLRFANQTKKFANYL